MKIFCFLFVISLAFAGFSQSSQLNVDKNEVKLNEPFKYKFELFQKCDSVEIPKAEFISMENIYLFNINKETETGMSKSIIYVIFFKALKSGEHQIPPFIYYIDGKPFSSPPFSINVLDKKLSEKKFISMMDQYLKPFGETYESAKMFNAKEPPKIPKDAEPLPKESFEISYPDLKTEISKTDTFYFSLKIKYYKGKNSSHERIYFLEESFQDFEDKRSVSYTLERTTEGLVSVSYYTIEVKLVPKETGMVKITKLYFYYDDEFYSLPDVEVEVVE
jgi:hypothetical protein